MLEHIQECDVYLYVVKLLQDTFLYEFNQVSTQGESDQPNWFYYHIYVNLKPLITTPQSNGN